MNIVTLCFLVIRNYHDSKFNAVCGNGKGIWNYIVNLDFAERT